MTHRTQVVFHGFRPPKAPVPPLDPRKMIGANHVTNGVGSSLSEAFLDARRKLSPSTRSSAPADIADTEVVRTQNDEIGTLATVTVYWRW